MRDISQEELAERENITQSTLSKIERGKYNNNVSVSLLIDIADCLQIDIALLVTFNDAERQMWWHALTESRKNFAKKLGQCPAGTPLLQNFVL